MKKLILIFLSLCFIVAGFSQDLIYKKDGSSINAEVIELTDEYLKYSDSNSNLVKIPILELTAIFYENGTSKLFSKEKSSKSKISSSKGTIVSASNKNNSNNNVSNPSNQVRGNEEIINKNSSGCFILKDKRAKKGIISIIDAQRAIIGRKVVEVPDKKGMTKLVISDLEEKLISRNFCNSNIALKGGEIEINVTKVIFIGRDDPFLGVKGYMIVEVEVFKIVSGFYVPLATYEGRTKSNVSMAGKKKVRRKFNEAIDSLLTNMGL